MRPVAGLDQPHPAAVDGRWRMWTTKLDDLVIDLNRRLPTVM
jgi:hypothetical protein